LEFLKIQRNKEHERAPYFQKGMEKKYRTALINHHYFTDYCQLLPNDKKKEHFEKLQKEIEKK
jgi:hypothetical protein